MTDELKACPFCGEMHRKVHWNKVIGYDDKDGLPILGQLNIGVDLTSHHPGGATVYVPVDLYNTRPIEDAQAAEIERLRDKLLKINDAYMKRLYPERDAWAIAREMRQLAIDGLTPVHALKDGE